MADPAFTFEEAVDQPKAKDSFTFEEATEPDLGVSGTLRAGALGAGAGWLEGVVPSMERIAGVISAIGPVTPPETPPIPGSLLEAEQRKRYLRTPGEIAKDASQNIAVQNADEVKKYWENTIPRTDQEKKNWLAQGAEQGTQMVPYALSAGAAPAVIGVESFANHIVDDYRQGKEKGMDDEEAGRLAIEKGFVSGTFQAGVFSLLPPYLKKAGEKLIVERFGEGALAKFLGKRAATATETAALFETSHAGENVVSGRPVTEGAGSTLLSGALFGAVTPRGPSPRAPEEARPPVTPEVRAQREHSLTEKAKSQFPGSNFEMVNGDLPGRPGQVAHTLPDGTVRVSLPNFHAQLENDLAKGASIDDAIDSVVTEESIHGVLRTMEGGDEIAKNYWNDLTAVEKFILKRRYHGSDYKGPRLSEAEYGHEAIRFALQRANDMKPGEFLFGGPGDVRTSKLLTSLEGVIRWIREKLGTKASQRQLAWLDQVQGNLDTAKKGANERGNVSKNISNAEGISGTQSEAPVTISDHEGLRTETTESIVARTQPGEQRDAAFSKRAASAREVTISLKPGDVIINEDGTRLVVADVAGIKKGKPTIYAYREGTAVGTEQTGNEYTLDPTDKIERKIKKGSQATTGRPPLYRGTTIEQWQAIQRGEQPQSEYTTGGNTWATSNLESAKGYTRATGKNSVVIEYKESAHDKVSKLTDDPGDHRRQGPLHLEDVQRVTDGEGNVIYESPKEKGASDASGITSPEGTTQREVRPPVGEEASLRQQGQTTEAQAPVAQGAQIPLASGEMTGPLKQAAYRDPQTGKVFTGAHHLEALDQAADVDPALTREDMAEKYGTRESRNTKDFGYVAIKDGKWVFVSRDQAGPIARNWKQDLTEFDVNEKGTEVPHSDEIAAKPGGEKAISEQAPPTAQTVGAQPRQAPAGKAATPGAAAPGEPAATESISTTPTDVQKGRLADLQQLLRIPDRIPTKAELQEYRALSKPMRDAVIAEARAKRAAASVPPPAMARRGLSKMPDELNDVDRVLAMPIDDFIKKSREFDKSLPQSDTLGRGPTRGAYELATTITSTERAEEIKRASDEISKQMQSALKKGDPQQAINLQAKKQFFDEALRMHDARNDVLIGGKTIHESQKKHGVGEKMLTDILYREAVEAGAPAMARRGKEPISDKDMSDAIVNAVRPGMTTHSREEITQIVDRLSTELAKVDPRKRHGFLTQFQIQYSEEIEKRAANDLSRMSVREEDKALQGFIEKARAQGFNVLPPMPEATRQLIDAGQIAHLNKPVKPKSVQTKPSAQQPLQKGGTPVSKAVRVEFDYGDYQSYWRAIHRMDPRVSEEYVRQRWQENVPAVLNNASPETIRQLLRAQGQDTERGRFGGTIGDTDASAILSAMAHQYPEPGTPGWEKYKELNKYSDAQASIAIKLAKSEAEDRFRSFAITRRMNPEQAMDRLKEIRNAELAEAMDQISGGTREGAQKPNVLEIRKGLEAAKQRRLKAVDFLNEKLVQQSKSPDRDPNRLLLTPDDIDSYATLTDAQSKNTAFLRSEMWRGTQVKGHSVSKLTRGVAVLVNPSSWEHHAVSFYLHPTSKDVMIYDPGLSIGDKTGKHIPLNSILGSWRIKSIMLLNSPVSKFHQRWRTAEGKSAESLFDSDIGWAGKIKEVGNGLEWTKYQRKLEAERKLENEVVKAPITEEELTGEEPANPEEKVKGKEQIEKLAERERAAYRAEEEGMSPGEAMLAESFESQVVGENYGKGPGQGEMGLLKTDPSRMVRGPMTGMEARAIANTFSEHELGGKPIKDVGDLLEMLKRLQFRRTHIGWWSGKPRGLRGQDYCFASGIDKMVRFWESRLLHQPDVKESLGKLSRPEKGKDYRDMTNLEKAYVDYREDIKQEALINALMNAHELAQESKSSKSSAEKGTYPYDAESFRTKALDIYGDTARRDIERSALSKEHATGKELSYEPRQPAGTRPRIPTEGVIPTEKQAGKPPEMLSPEAQGSVAAQAEERFGQFYHVPKQPYENPQPTADRTITGPPSNLQPGTFLREAVRNRMSNPPAMTRRHGVSNRSREQMEGEGRAMPIQPRQALGEQETIELGKSNWKSWADASHMMSMAEEGGGSNWPVDPAVARYGDFLLTKEADRMADIHGPNSAEYNQALEAEQEWGQRLHNAYKVAWSETGHGFQGDQDTTTGSYTAIKRELEDAFDRDLTEDEALEAQAVSKRVLKAKRSTNEVMAKVGDALAKPPDVDVEGLTTMKVGLEGESKKISQQGLEALKKLFPDEPAMAMKGMPEKALSPEAVEALSKIGSDVMIQLSKSGDLNEARWREEMQKIPKIGNRFDDHLGQLYRTSEQFRNELLNRYIGQGNATKPLKNLFSRVKPTVEQSFSALARAMEADPQGKNITQQEAYHVWNIMKQMLIDKGVRDPDEIRVKAAQLIGFGIDKVYPQMRLYEATATNRSVRKVSQEMIKLQRDEARITNNAKNWIKNQKYPGWLQFIRKVPRFFFMDRIYGHGLTPMDTHAGNMMFNPYAYKTYFKAWRDMYAMTFGGKKGTIRLTAEEYHKWRVSEVTGHDNFEMWRGVGLQVDPFRYTDDYQIAALQGFFAGKTGSVIKRFNERAIAGWGFDALKGLRLARANQWWNTVPDHYKTKQMAVLIAESINHATGTIESRFTEGTNWLFFAPKLWASQFAFLFKDPLKAIDFTLRSDATPEQKLWARSELKQKTVMMGMYAGLLFMNQGFLSATGSNQKINFFDPSKPDWLYFKVAGFKIGVATPMIGIFRLFANLIHSGMGKLKPMERAEPRQMLMAKDAGRYIRGKFSPFASTVADLSSSQDVTGRPLPWSKDQIPWSRRMHGVTQYGKTEWALQQVSPIPAEGFFREMWSDIGMDETTIQKLFRALVMAGTMAATGVRVSRDKP